MNTPSNLNWEARLSEIRETLGDPLLDSETRKMLEILTVEITRLLIQRTNVIGLLIDIPSRKLFPSRVCHF